MSVSNLSMRIVAAAVAVLLLPWLCVRDALACSCYADLTRVADAYNDAAAVFVGRVERIQIVESDSESAPGTEEGSPAPRFDGVIAKLAVTEVFKGIEAAEVVVGSERGCFTFRFAEGESYLFYAFREPDDPMLMVSSCSRSRRTLVAGTDLEYLRGLPEMRAETRLSGTLSWAEELGQSDRSRPLANIRVTLEGARGALVTVSDAAGIYRFPRIAPGDYTLTVHLPEHLTTMNPSLPMKIDPAWEVRDYVAWLNGRIRGRLVRPEGSPLRNAKVAVARAEVSPDSNEYAFPHATFTDESGTFVLEGLSSDRYVLVVSPSGRADRDSPFPRTFFPGVGGWADAEVISVRAGEETSVRDFVVPRSLERVALRGVVVDKAGRPWPKAWVSVEEIVPEREEEEFAPGDRAWSGTVEADESGRFSIDVLSGRNYEVSAAVHLQSDRNESTNRVVVRARKNPPAVRLVAPIVRAERSR